MPVKHRRGPDHHRRQSWRGYVLEQLHLAGLGRRLSESYAQLAQPARRLVVTDSAYVFYAYLATIFVNVYLWKQSRDFSVPAAYDLAIFVFCLLIFWLVALLPFRLPAKRLVQAGLLVSVIRYLLLLFIGVDGPLWAGMIGVVGGISVGLYWSGNHALTYTATTDADRDQYYGLTTSITYLVSIIAPALGGLLIAEQEWFDWIPIGQSGYQALFLATIVTLLITAVTANRLSDVRIEPTRTNRILALAKLKRWRFMLAREFLDGLMTGPVNFIGVVLAFTILGDNELSLGVFSSVFALLAAVAALLIGGLIDHDNRHRIRFGYLGAALFVVSTAIYIGLFNFTGMVISSFIDILAGPMFAIGMAATFYHAIDKSLDRESNYYAYIVLRETILTIGRVVSIVLFLVTLRLADDLTVAKVWYLALFLLPLGFCLLTKMADKADKETAGIGPI